jgi:quinol monooxygenase YgiN
MTPFVVLVELRLKAGAKPAFRVLMDENARCSAATEPGCRRFDVVEPREDPDALLLYEIYEDEAAFDAHLATAHYARFDVESAPLLKRKRITAGHLVYEASATAKQV